MRYSIIIPCYNEARNLPQCGQRLLDALDQMLPAGEFEVRFVCDGVTDDTKERLQTLHHPAMHIDSYETNRGKGYAVRYGMLCAKGDIRLFCDCDLAYGTEAIGQMLAQMEETDAHVCVASRRLHPDGYEGYTFLRRFVSSVYYIMIRCLTGLKLSDSQSGLKAFEGKMAEKIFSLAEIDRFAFDLEVLMLADRLGCRITEMPARIIENSPSSIRLSDPFRMLRDVLRIRRRVRKLKLTP